MDSAIEKLLLKMLELGASDLHLSSGAVPTIRVHGVIQAIPGYPPFTEDDLLARLYEITPPRNREEFERRNDTDFAHAIPGVSRFRANLFRDRHGPGAVFRAIPFQIRSPEELGLPKSVLELCDLTKGLVLVTGPTGSGKSTTLATLIDHINQNRTDHIITIEDPIEFVHENKKCLVNQREVHAHTDSFKDALRAALREDPDIVLVGEMRDLETIAIAVETAETGHLVFGTLHTTTAPSTVDRIIDQFPADRQEQIRTMLAGLAARRHLPDALQAHRRRARGGLRDPDLQQRRREPDPRAQDLPDLLGHADLEAAGHDDAERLAPRAREEQARRPQGGLHDGGQQDRSSPGITEYRLANGLRVLLFPDPTKQTITVNITYIVGSRHENYGETGMAHLLEHLMFKGTPKHPNIPQELTRARRAPQRLDLVRPHELLRDLPARPTRT